MENDNQNKIYIREDEEIPSIVSKIKRCSEKDVVLIVPRNALILNNVLNLKILKKEAESLSKEISIITADDESETEEESIGINFDVAGNEKKSSIDPIVEPDDLLRSKKEDKTNFNSLNNKRNIKASHRGKIKMFDIVKKVNNVGRVDNMVREPDIEKMDDEKINNYQEDIKNSSDNAKFQVREEIVNSTKKTKKKKITILSSLNSKMVALFIFISLVAVSLAMAIILPKADVGIILKKEVAVYDFEFMADKSLSEIDIANNKVPLKKIEVSSEESGSYSTTGIKHVQEKASGEITIFNEYSSSPYRIVATTRFLSKESNKLFRIAEAVTIPGFSRVEGVDVPGQVTIKIYADEIGEEYNIGPDSFQLPGLQGSAKYTSVYARSVKAMSGGMDKEVTYFSESDYANAEEELAKLVEKKNEKDFSEKVSENDFLLENTKKEEKLDVSADVKVGDIVDNFQISVKAKTSISLISISDLDKIINEKINSRLDTNKELLDDSRSYEVGDIMVGEDEKIIMPIHINQGLIVKIDIDNLKENIAGKSEAELNSYFSNMDGVKSTDICLWPFWVKNIPSSYEKINIAIDINNPV
ncbi:MAG: hypothetical protein U9P70_03075 [Patescibacteria group bacterium]|nr:hypothetical protein [Patescibacteria group bacterium]